MGVWLTLRPVAYAVTIICVIKELRNKKEIKNMTSHMITFFFRHMHLFTRPEVIFEIKRQNKHCIVIHSYTLNYFNT